MNPRRDVRRPYQWRGMVAALLAALLLAAAALPAAANDEPRPPPGGSVISNGGVASGGSAEGGSLERENPILDSATPCGNGGPASMNEPPLTDLFTPPSQQTNTRLPQTAVQRRVVNFSVDLGDKGLFGSITVAGSPVMDSKIVLLLSVPGEKAKQTIVVNARTSVSPYGYYAAITE